MERELWPLLYRLLQRVAKTIHQKNVTYQPWVVVAVVLWAALHDRPISWACRPEHWSTTRLRPWQLPSPSTMSRRANTVGTALAWRALEVLIREQDEVHCLSFLDGKPLVVGGASKDREARAGRAVGGFGRGYKLHALWSNRAIPEAWYVEPLNIAEADVADRLVRQAARGGYLLADGNYDASPLLDAAAEAGYQMLVPPPAQGAGRGHHYQSPFRLRSIKLMQMSFGQELYAQRIRIECLFGNACSFAGGMATLPPWVRHLPRVRTWTWAKLLINAVRIERKRLAA
jgi:hypothetical protein